MKVGSCEKSLSTASQRSDKKRQTYRIKRLPAESSTVISHIQISNYQFSIVGPALPALPFDLAFVPHEVIEQ